MVEFRTFRNGDPPAIVKVWNASVAGRGAARLANPSILERFVFAKPYFDPAGLTLAWEGAECVGFAHAGGCRSADRDEVHGVTCAVLVRPDRRRQGIGSRLLQASEAYLKRHDAQKIFAGGHASLNPYYAGLYGGADCPGFLKSDTAAEPFFRRNRYQVSEVNLVMHRDLKKPVTVADPRLAGLKQRYNVVVGSPRKLGGWWAECTVGCLEPVEFAIEDREKRLFAGRALVWEMETFSQLWAKPSVGILAFDIRPEYRSQGLGKLLLAHILRQLQEQFFELIEVQIPERNLVALSLLRGLGFETADRGQVFAKLADEPQE